MNKFLNDKFYLLRYSIIHCLIFFLLSFVLFNFREIDLDLSWRPIHIFYILTGLSLCGLPSGLLHNCAHRNVGPRWFNDLVGEFLGSVMLYGYRGFSLGHMFHHKYPDNPKYDPHPPRGYSFLRFVVSPIEATLIIIERAFYEQFGDNTKNRSLIKYSRFFFNLSIVLKLVFWFLFLGASAFIYFYMVLYMANIFVFAHINYATHIENEDGSSEIINLDNNLYYKVVNKISLGGYYHKNHHLRPRIFNPSKVVIKKEMPLISYTPEYDLRTPKRGKLFSLSWINGLEELTQKLKLD
ncbi:fatty acid desaturase family protein [Halobacteriovorax marinus]|uniref:fatty acid desaturase family protein n=1 Tax=Halobacteriovorax marinus TaxID=97084 RepID=UPI003A8CBAA9